MWLVPVAGTNRGTITQLEVHGEQRYSARLRHFNPGRARRIRGVLELEKAVAAILAETPKLQGRDPFRQLTNYASRDDMRERAERETAQKGGPLQCLTPRPIQSSTCATALELEP